ncbi:MAG: hypothetical protein KJ624_06935 [Chloroflexi bacterium]|nr:hypothetical protein [Chloroflexota bacterium]
MAFPSAAHAELGVLRAIVEAGGEAMTEDPSFYRLIALYFPEINGEDLSLTTPDTGEDLWTAKCKRLFIRLAKRGEIGGIDGDTLAITEVGLARLKKEWLPEWGFNPIREPPPLTPENLPPWAQPPPPDMWPGAPPPPPGVGR